MATTTTTTTPAGTKPSVALHAFEKHPGIPTASGFCQKAECYFRFAGVDFHEVVSLPMKAPKGKLPFVVIDGTTVPDSQFIVRHLKNSGIADLDKTAGLNPLQIADSNAYRGFWEEGIYNAVVMTRWMIPENEPVIRKEIFGDLPFYLRIPFSWYFRRTITNNLIAAGVGRHTADEVHIMIGEAMEGLETRLAVANKSSTDPTKPAWFHGTASPSDIDASMSAFLINLCATESNPVSKNLILKSDVLRNYMKMVVEMYFPEYQVLLKEIGEAEKKAT